VHASQHFNRVRLAVPATRDLVCESKVALIECQQQRMLQKQSSKKKEREFQLQMRRSRSRGRSGLFSSSRRTCVSILCVWERERKERGEEEERKRRRREGKEKESSLSRRKKFSPPAAGETPDPANAPEALRGWSSAQARLLRACQQTRLRISP
jgi:hypothetical protein